MSRHRGAYGLSIRSMIFVLLTSALWGVVRGLLAAYIGTGVLVILDPIAASESGTLFLELFLLVFLLTLNLSFKPKTEDR